MKQLAIIGLLCLISIGIYSQEKAGERVTTYFVELNALKHESQVTNIESSVSKLANVFECELNWIEYALTFKVIEGQEKGNFPMEQLKAIIDENNAQLVNFKKEIKK